MDNSLELTHWGVKGMKWGVRRYQNKDGSLTPAGKKRYSESDDYLKAKELKKKKMSQLSNAELRELNNRMQLESQYKNLTRQNVSSGRKFVKDVMYEVGKNVTAEYAKKYSKQGLEYVGRTYVKPKAEKIAPNIRKMFKK